MLQDWYGFNFLVPGAGGDSSRIFAAGPDPITRYLTVNPSGSGATPWLRFNDGSDGVGGQMWGSAVQYEPGRIMRCGRRDTQGPNATDTTCVINLNASSPQWIASADMAHTRAYHNLVVLPTGQVLVTGGMGTVQNDQAINPRQTPEIWDPGGNGGAGAWYGGTGPNALATDPMRRGYHSTALLLPDARVLCAGGNHHDETFTDLRMANLYCPPYLFKADGSPATRPVILGNHLSGECATSPCGGLETTSWGESFTLCVDNAAKVEKVALIRPGSTTHGFDQNQRYVPLSFTRAYSPDRLVVTGPASSAHAPPGDYMLFIVGSAAGDSVPSHAKWIRLEARDATDATAPFIDEVLPDIVTANSILLTWTAPADDGQSAPSGKVKELLLRRSTAAPIMDPTTWESATRVCDMPAPLAAGEYQEKNVTGLSCCTYYHFQLRARDDKPQLSDFLGISAIRTLCYTGCGGTSAHESRHETAAASPRVIRGGATAAPATGAILCETSPVAGGGWEVAIRMETLAAASDAGLKVESRVGGGWTTRGRLESGAGPYGICALREGGRISMTGSYRLEQIATAIAQRGGMALTSAIHSRLGDVAEAIRSAGLAPLQPGDTLRLLYAPDAHAARSGESWFALVRHGEPGSIAAVAPQQTAAAIPVRFALHQNQPNPFRGVTTIRFDLPRRAAVRLDIFDLMGRRVRTLARRDFAPGYHALEWDHRDTDGRHLAPGIYVYRLQAGEFRARRKMTLVP